MDAYALANLDGVEPPVVRTSPARQLTAVIMAPQPMQTNWMVALAIVLKVGVVPVATLTSRALQKKIAAPMAQLRIRTTQMAAFVSANLAGKVTAARVR